MEAKVIMLSNRDRFALFIMRFKMKMFDRYGQPKQIIPRIIFSFQPIIILGGMSPNDAKAFRRKKTHKNIEENHAIFISEYVKPVPLSNSECDVVHQLIGYCQMIKYIHIAFILYAEQRTHFVSHRDGS